MKSFWNIVRKSLTEIAISVVAAAPLVGFFVLVAHDSIVTAIGSQDDYQAGYDIGSNGLPDTAHLYQREPPREWRRGWIDGAKDLKWGRVKK